MAFVVAVMLALSTQTALEQYAPPTEGLVAELIGPSTLTFTVPSVWGYRDSQGAFSDCAFSLGVNGTAAGPTDAVLGANGPAQGMQVRMFKDAGISGACVVSEGDVSYIVHIVDSDGNGHLSLNDTIVVQATRPLSADATYSLTLITEVDSARSYGLLTGSYG